MNSYSNKHLSFLIVFLHDRKIRAFNNQTPPCRIWRDDVTWKVKITSGNQLVPKVPKTRWILATQAFVFQVEPNGLIWATLFPQFVEKNLELHSTISQSQGQKWSEERTNWNIGKKHCCCCIVFQTIFLINYILYCSSYFIFLNVKWNAKWVIPKLDNLINTSLFMALRL
jgi:hypothetical protein